MKLAPKLYEDLVGKPFRAGARGPEAYDCLGLVLAVTRRRGVNLPDYDSTTEELHRQFGEGAGVLGPCRSVQGAEGGAVVLMRSLGGVGRHLGVMVDRYRMLHASERAGSVVLEDLAHSLWARRVLGYYLPEDL